MQQLAPAGDPKTFSADRGDLGHPCTHLPDSHSQQTPTLGQMAQQRWLQRHSGTEQTQCKKKTQHQLTQEAGDCVEELVHEQYDSTVAIAEEKVERTTTVSHFLSLSSIVICCLQVSSYRRSVPCQSTRKEEDPFMSSGARLT